MENKEDVFEKFKDYAMNEFGIVIEKSDNKSGVSFEDLFGELTNYLKTLDNQSKV